MLTRIKQYALIAVVIGALYYLLSHHFIIISWNNFGVLKKGELTLSHTFHSIRQSTPEESLGVDALREAGIGEWMVQKGMLSEEKLDQILMKLEYAQ